MDKHLSTQEKGRWERAKAKREAGQVKRFQAKIKEIEAEQNRPRFTDLDAPPQLDPEQ